MAIALTSASLAGNQKKQVLDADDAFLLLTSEAKADAKARGYGRASNGKAGKNTHLFAGVIACGYCLDDGRSFQDAAMAGAVTEINGTQRRKAGDSAHVPAVRCARAYKLQGAMYHPIFLAREDCLEPMWDSHVARLAQLPDDPAHLERWRQQEEAKRAQMHAEIAHADQLDAAIKTQRERIFSMLTDNDEAVARQARAALRDLDEQDKKLEAMRARIAQNLEHLDPNTSVRKLDNAQLAAILHRYCALYANAQESEKNALNRLLVRAVGSMPRISRDESRAIVFSWPEVEAMTGIAPHTTAARRTAKLTADQVREIRSLHAVGGVSNADLAREYGVDDKTMSRIVKGERWKHVL